MKSATVLAAVAAAASAFVIPEQQVFAGLNKAPAHDKHSGFEYYEHFFDHVREEIESAFHSVHNGLKEGVDHSKDYLSQASSYIEDIGEQIGNAHSIEHEEAVEVFDKPDPDQTIWELISSSNLSKRFAKLVAEFDDIKDLLDKKDANVTVYVPWDKAFEKIPEDAPKPPKEFVEAFLKVHISPEVWNSRRIFGAQTLPTLLEGKNLSSKPKKTPQRLAVKLGWRGIYLNNFNRIGHKDMVVSNGIVHGTEGFNFPPPPIGVFVRSLPTVFSTFELALHKTGLAHIGRAPHLGATVFAPVNQAWLGLGYKANAFLFSKCGRKYLKGLLAYHIVANQTLYTDAYYGPSDEKSESFPKRRRTHVDLPTLLPGKSVGVDIGQFGRLVSMHINHYSRAVYTNAAAYDGVFHVIDKLLIPSCHHKDGTSDAYEGGELSVEDLMQRLEPYVDHNEDESASFLGDWMTSEL